MSEGKPDSWKQTRGILKPYIGKMAVSEEKAMTVGDLKDDIDVLNLSTKTKNNLRYYGYNTVADLKCADIWNHPKFQIFSSKLNEILEAASE